MPDPIVDPPKPPTVTISASSLTDTGRRVSDAPLMATLPGHPDMIVQVIQPVTIVAVRALRVFFQTLLGALSAGMTGIIHAQDFMHLLITCASISVAATVICIIQNIIELLNKFDQTHPTLAG